jgi:hypothetical protein
MRHKGSLAVILAAAFAFSTGVAQGMTPAHRGHPPMHPSSKPKPTSPAAPKPAVKPHK